MRVQGKITDWNDPRGFGFVSPLERGERVFVHVSAFPSGSRRPTEGEFVSYTLGTDERDRLYATQVTYVVSQAKRSAVRAQARNKDLIAGFVAATFLGVRRAAGNRRTPLVAGGMCLHRHEHGGVLRVQARQGGRPGRREAN